MAPAGRSRPSLLDAVQPSPPPDFQLSVLDALNTPETPAPRRPAAVRRPWAKAALAFVGVAAGLTASVLLWAQLQAAPSQDNPAIQLAISSPSVAAPAASANPADPASTTAAAPAATLEAAQAARIEDTALAVAAAPPPVEAGASMTASPFDKLASAEPVSAAKPVASTKPVHNKPTEAAAAKRHPPRPRDAAAKPGGQTRSASTAPASRAAAAKPGADTDADVAIMTALMNHMNEANAAANGAADASIADLVRHCRSQPGAEAQACQRRICQGYWGRAEACPRDRQTALRAAGPASP